MADVDFDDLIPKQPTPSASTGDLSFDDLVPKKTDAPPVAPGAWNDPTEHSRFGQAAMSSLMRGTADIFDTERQAEQGLLGDELPVSKYVTGPAADWLKKNAPQQAPAVGTGQKLEDLSGNVIGGFAPGAVEYAGKVPFAAFHGYKTAEDEAHAEGREPTAGEIAKDVVLEAGARKVMGLIENAPIGRIKKALGFGAVTGAEDVAEGKDKEQAAQGAAVNALLGAVLPGGHRAPEEPVRAAPPDYAAPIPAKPDVPTPAAAPDPGEVVGVKFPKGPSQRATVDSYWDDGQSVRVRFDDGSAQDMLTHELLRDRTEPPPPLNEEVRGPEGKGVAPSEAERFNIWDEADREAPYPNAGGRATQAPLGTEMLDAVRRADALEQQANDPGARMTDEQRNDALMAAQRLRAQYGHIGAPISVGPEEQAALQAARVARGVGPDDALLDRVPPAARGPAGFTPEEIETARQNMGTTPNILGQEVPNLNPAPGQFSPQDMAVAQDIRQKIATQRAEAAAAAEADKRAAVAAAKTEAPAPLLDAQGNTLPTADGRSTLLVPVPKLGAQSLTQWVRANGGIKDTSGDLVSMYLANGKKPAPGIVANKNGTPADVMAQRAREAGYFPEVPDDPTRPDELTSNHLLDAIQAEINGNPKYSANDQGAVEARQAAIAHNETVKNLSGLHGVDYRGVSPEQFSAAVQHSEMRARAAELGIELKGDETPAEVQNLVHEREALATDYGAMPDLADRIDRETDARFGHDFPEQRDELPWGYDDPLKPAGGFAEQAQDRAVRAAGQGQEPLAGTAPVGERPAQIGEAGAEAAGAGERPSGAPQADAASLGEQPSTQAGAPFSVDRTRDFHEFAADAGHRVDRPAASNRSASDYVTSRGAGDGNEHSVVVDGRTGRVIEAATSGRDNFVAFSEPLLEKMQDPGASLVMHHNHPQSTGPSPQDIGALGYPGVSEVVVSGHDGEVSAVRLTPEFEAARQDRPALFKNNVVGNMARAAYNAIYNNLAGKVRSGLISKDVANALHTELVNHSLAAVGATDYIGTRPLDEMGEADIGVAVQAGARAAGAYGIINGLPIRSADDVRLYRPPTGVRPDRALEDVSRRASEAAAARSPDPAGDRGSAGNDQVEADRQAAAGVTQRVERTDQGDQYVMPGAERSAVQAAAARADLMRASKPQRPADEGLFARQSQDNQQTDLFGNATLAPKQAPIQGSLFEGAPGLAETDKERYGSERAGPQYATRAEQPTMAPKDYDPLDDLSYQIAQNGGDPPPGVVARRAGAMMPSPKGGLPEKMLGAVTKFAIMPRTLASVDARSARFWRAWQDKDVTARALQHTWSDASQDYAGLTSSQRDRLSAVEEIDRLGGTTRRDDGRQIVARNEALTRTELSRPGDTVVLDPATTAVYHQRRAMFRDMWDTMMRSSAIKMWPTGIEYNGSIDPAEIQAMASAAPHKAITKQLTNVVNLMASMQEQRNQAYTPLMRFGDYYIAIKPKPGTTSADAMNWDGSGFPPTARFELVDSKSSDTLLDRLAGKVIKQGAVPAPAVDRIAQLRQRYPEDQYDLESDYLSRKPGALEKLNIPALERMFIALQQKDSKLFGPMAEDLRNKMYEELRAGFKKRSDNVPGYDLDFGRATGAYIGWLSNHAAELQHGDAIRAAQETFIDTHPDKQVRRYWENWTDYQNNPVEELQKLRQAGFYWQMAGNPASTLSVLLHGPIVAHTTLGVGAGYGAAGRHLYGAFGDALRNLRFNADVGAHIDMDAMGRSPAEKALVREAVGSGLVHSNMAEDLRGLGQNQAEMMGVDPSRWKKVLNVLSSNIGVADQVNRVGVLLGAYRLASEPGMLDKIAKTWGDNQVFRETMETHGLTPENVAKFMVDEGLFVWGKRNRAPLQRGFGALLFQFKNFEANYLGALHKFMTRMGPEGKVAGSLMLMSLGALGGALALPFTDDIKKAADAIGQHAFGIDPMIESKMYQMLENAGLSKAGAEMMLRGPSRAVLGVDLNSRLGMGEVVSRNLSPLDAFGTVPSMIASRATSAWNRYQHGQTLAAASDLLPTALRNLVRGAAVLPQQGLQTQYGNTVIPRDKISGGTQVATALGYEPTQVARAYDEREFQSRTQKADQEIRSRLTSHVVDLEEQLLDANKRGDEKAAESLRGQISAIYTANPDVRISREATRRGLEKRLDPEGAARRTSMKKTRAGESPYPGTDEQPQGHAGGGAVQAAADRVDTNPTTAQKHAGNYRKGHVFIHGLDISIENPKGSFRSGHDADGKPWRARLLSHYGYFRRTEGADGDAVDVFIGPDHKSDRVFVIDQVDLKTGHFDEHKTLMNFPNLAAALYSYKHSFSDKKGEQRIGNVRAMSIGEFKDWLRNGDTTRSIAA